MNTQQLALGLINVVGGILVLGSYAHGIITHPANRDAIWGGVPETIKPLYTANMLFAAAGYLAFTYFVMFSLNRDSAQLANLSGFKAFYIIYALILIPSALWMPLTYAAIDHPSSSLYYWAVRITLAIVGLASLALLGVLLSLHSSESSPTYWLAVAGSVFFCIQTALLDAVVWSFYFRVQ
jgi:hypothetical protein